MKYTILLEQLYYITRPNSAQRGVTTMCFHPSTSSCDWNSSSYSFFHNKVWNRLIANGVENLVYIYINKKLLQEWPTTNPMAWYEKNILFEYYMFDVSLSSNGCNTLKDRVNAMIWWTTFGITKTMQFTLLKICNHCLKIVLTLKAQFEKIFLWHNLWF